MNHNRGIVIRPPGHRCCPGWGSCWRHAARGAAVSTRMRNLLMGGLGELRREPTGKRIRAVLDGGTVVDTTRALLVWEPQRIVPSYAVPADDIAAELAPADAAAADATGTIGVRMPELSGRPVLDPSVPFAVHSAEGRA